MEEKYILVSLEEEKSKQIANVLSNNTSRKILDYLANRSLSESDIARDLNLPLSTVHYNIQNMHKNDFVEVKDFVYSEKGNKINIYSISKKLILIAPKGIELKTLLPVLGLSALVSIIMYISYNIMPDVLVKQSMKSAMMESESMAAPLLAGQATIMPNYPLWFLAGSVFALLFYVLISYVRGKS